MHLWPLALWQKAGLGFFSTRINAAKVFKGTYNRKFSSKTFHLQPQHCDDLIMAQKNKTLQNCGSSIAHYSCVSRRIIEGLMLAVQHFDYQAFFDWLFLVQATFPCQRQLSQTITASVSEIYWVTKVVLFSPLIIYLEKKDVLSCCVGMHRSRLENAIFSKWKVPSSFRPKKSFHFENLESRWIA